MMYASMRGRPEEVFSAPCNGERNHNTIEALPGIEGVIDSDQRTPSAGAARPMLHASAACSNEIDARYMDMDPIWRDSISGSKFSREFFDFYRNTEGGSGTTVCAAMETANAPSNARRRQWVAVVE